jgi:single-stranded-DNA-specific exonuclease
LEKRWKIARDIPEHVRNELGGFTAIQQNILYQRGVKTSQEAHEFINGEAIEFEDPFLLRGMEEAVKRIEEAIAGGEKIIVYGDYDADGITATALLRERLREMGALVEHYIPDRFMEGYGLNKKALTDIRKEGASLVITVDCGVRAVEEVKHAGLIGLDVIVTDHHFPGEEVPAGVALINPKQNGDSYPFKHLAGVGLAYKLAHGLSLAMGKPEPTEDLDLVAIGTVADMVILRSENRELVRRGLVELNQTKRQGLRALIEEIRYEFGKITTNTIGYGIGPRLNAAGRIETADVAYRLLIEHDFARAKRIAAKLDGINRDRQKITMETVDKACELGVGDGEPPLIIFATDPGFNEGVLGLAASRLTERYFRPSFVATSGSTHTRASGRSVPGFHLARALDACSDLLERYGGHAAAAGFSVRNDNVDPLRKRLHDLAKIELEEEKLYPEIEIDAKVPFDQIDEQLMQFIEDLEPCGNGNPRAVFAAQDVFIQSRRQVGKGKKHLKLTLAKNQVMFDAIAFRLGDLYESLPSQVDVAYRLERNDYWGVPTLELNIIDIRPTGSFSDPHLTV